MSAFEDITEKSFPGKWKVIYFYPKDMPVQPRGRCRDARHAGSGGEAELRQAR